MFRARSDNGHGGTAVVDDLGADEGTQIVDDDEDSGPERAATGSKVKKQSKGKKAGLAVLAIVILIGIVAALFLSGFFSNKKVMLVEAPGRELQQSASTAPDAEQAITSLGEQMRSNAPVVQASPGVTPPTSEGVLSLPQKPVTGAAGDVGNVPVTSLPGYPGMEVAGTNGVAGTVPGVSPGAGALGSHSGTRAVGERMVRVSEIESGPAKQTSTYFFGTAAVKPAAGEVGSGVKEEAVPLVRSLAKTAPVVPPFGATLPVRALGAIYSLRSESYVRLETTRAVKGDGWSLPRGTQLIARQSGAQNDRLFLNLIGYLVDGKLVRVGGEVSGVDGGAGLQGARKRIGKRWLNALRGIGSGGVQLLTSWLAGRGGGTQIYLPGGSLPEIAGQGAQQPVSEFVAVKAGTLGTVMVTDLPEAVSGEQGALAADTAGPSGMMSEDEVLELMTSGSAEEIRAALPRMPRQVRPVAEAALKGN